jgi:DNA-binding CsgD family transcriptional regulator
MMVEGLFVAGTVWPNLFVGRRAEIALLEGLLDAGARGEGGLCLMAGEPGAGKTRLLKELVDRARSGGWLVLAGETGDSAGLAPYASLLDALRPFLQQRSHSELGTLLGQESWAFARLLPELRRALPGLTEPDPLSPEFERHRFFECISTPLRRLASSCAADGLPGLLLVLDGLQSSDAATPLFLAHLSLSLGEAPLCVVATYRDVGPGAIDPATSLSSALAATRAKERLRLEGLTNDDIAPLLRSCGRAEQLEEAVAEIGRATAGNALFVAEVARLLSREQSSSADVAGPRSAWRTALSDDLRSVSFRRLERLSPAGRRLLSAAALFGRDCSSEELGQAANLAGVALRDTLCEAESAGVLVPSATEPRRFRFSDPLLRDLVLGQLRGSDRTRLHAAIGLTLEQAPQADSAGPLSELAYHFSQAAPICGPEKAIAYCRSAGDRSMALFAYETAVRQYTAALRALALHASAQQEEHCELLLRLAAAQQGAGEDAARETCLHAAELARSLPSADLLACAALAICDTQGSGGIGDAATAGLLGEAVAALGQQQQNTRALCLSRLAVELTYFGDAERAAQLSREAVAIARSTGDARLLGSVLIARHRTRHEPEALAESAALATELVRIAEAQCDREMALQGRHLRLLAALEMGEFERVENELVVIAELADKLAVPFYQWRSTMLRSMLAILRGTPPTTFVTAQRMSLSREQATMAELLGELLVLVEQHPGVPAWRAALAWAQAETGNVPLARAELEGLTANDVGRLPRDENWLQAAVYLAETCSLLHAEDSARSLYPALLPYSGRTVVAGGAVCMGSVDRLLGLLAHACGDLTAAEAHLRRALEMHHRMDARPLEARTQYDLAAVYFSMSKAAKVEGALALLGAAEATAAQLGMIRLQQQIDALRSSAGLVEADSPAQEPNAKPALLLPDHLTMREAEVLKLIAGGCSNKVIADSLMVSVRTIEHHITNIYGKIGARGKADATAYAVRQHLA